MDQRELSLFPSTLKLILSYLKRDSSGKLSAEEIFSEACYNRWLKNRQQVPKKPEEAFRKIICGHCKQF